MLVACRKWTLNDSETDHTDQQTSVAQRTRMRSCAPAYQSTGQEGEENAGKWIGRRGPHAGRLQTVDRGAVPSPKEKYANNNGIILQQPLPTRRPRLDKVTG